MSDRPEGFAMVPTWMIRDRAVPRSALLVYAALSSRSGLGAIFPSQTTIAQESGLSERTVRDMIGGLERLGVITRTRRMEKGRRLSDGYRLHPNGLAADSAGTTTEPAERTGNGPQITPLIEVENRGNARERKKPSTVLPEGWRPTPEHEARAAAMGVDVALEAESFRAHAEANDRRAVRWDAAFTQWLLKARPSSRPVEQLDLTAKWGAGNEWMEYR